MKDLIEILPFLKYGVDKKSYPIYASYLSSVGSRVKVCNDIFYIEADAEVPFYGNVNFFVLESVLKTRENLECIDSDTIVSLTDNKNFNSKLPKMPLDFPELNRPNLKYLVLSREMIESIKLASLFTGTDMYSSVMLFEKGIIASDKLRMYYNPIDLDLESLVSLNKKVIQFISLLAEKYTIGLSEKEVLCIDFGRGYALCPPETNTEYPYTKIVEFVNSLSQSVTDLCKVDELLKALKDASPVFFGETSNAVFLDNDNRGLDVIASSPLNGEIKVGLESLIQKQFKTQFQASMFKSIPSDYVVSIDPENPNKLFLKTAFDKSSIVLMGLRLD